MRYSNTVENLQNEIAGLRNANELLTHEMETLMGMSFEEFEEHKADLNAALTILNMSKGRHFAPCFSFPVKQSENADFLVR